MPPALHHRVAAADEHQVNIGQPVGRLARPEAAANVRAGRRAASQVCGRAARERLVRQRPDRAQRPALGAQDRALDADGGVRRPGPRSSMSAPRRNALGSASKPRRRRLPASVARRRARTVGPSAAVSVKRAWLTSDSGRERTSGSSVPAASSSASTPRRSPPASARSAAIRCSRPRSPASPGAAPSAERVLSSSSAVYSPGRRLAKSEPRPAPRTTVCRGTRTNGRPARASRSQRSASSVNRRRSSNPPTPEHLLTARHDRGQAAHGVADEHARQGRLELDPARG